MLKVIFRSMLVTSMRDKITLFYSLLFPIGLIVGLGIYFQEGDMPERILAGVTAISTIFWGMQGIAFQVHSQRNKGVYKLLMLTPLPIQSFVLIMTLARTVIGVGLTMVVWFSGMLFLELDFSMVKIFTTLLLVVVGTLCFTSIGFFIANIANHEGQINMYANLLQLPMIFMSEAFYPLTTAPEWIKFTGKLLPFEHYVNGLRGGDMLLGFLVPLLYMVISLLLASRTFRWESQERTIGRKTRKSYS